MSKSKEALALLDDLDSFTAPPAAPPPKAKAKAKTSSISSASGVPPPGPPPVNDKDAADALAFLDEITQKSAEPRKTLQALPATTTRVTLGGGSRPGTPSQGLRKSTEVARGSPKLPDASPPQPAAGGGWGWGSVWNTASAALAQAKEVVDEQVKNLPQQDQARKWGEGVLSYAKQAQLDKIGMCLYVLSLTGTV